MCGQERNVLLSFPQCREANIQNIQTKIEITAEGAIANGLLQIAVGRSQNSDIDGNCLGASDRADLPFLKGAQVKTGI